MEQIYRDRLREVWAWVSKQTQLKSEGLPHQWYQDAWSVDLDAMKIEEPSFATEMAKHVGTDCGTAFCMAGHVVAQTLMLQPNYNDEGFSDYVKEPHTLSGGRMSYEIDEIAADYLGLRKGSYIHPESEYSSYELFNGQNDYFDVAGIMHTWGLITDAEYTEATGYQV